MIALVRAGHAKPPSLSARTRDEFRRALRRQFQTAPRRRVHNTYFSLEYHALPSNLVALARKAAVSVWALFDLPEYMAVYYYAMNSYSIWRETKAALESSFRLNAKRPFRIGKRSFPAGVYRLGSVPDRQWRLLFLRMDAGKRGRVILSLRRIYPAKVSSDYRVLLVASPGAKTARIRLDYNRRAYISEPLVWLR